VTKLPRISGRECIDALVKGGFVIRRRQSSHVVLRRDNSFLQLVVPDHKELDRGTLRAILRQGGLTIEQFLELLG
jgi:predicted RNA binding protein YcfA (HicA-like mRNA interferase family)